MLISLKILIAIQNSNSPIPGCRLKYAPQHYIFGAHMQKISHFLWLRLSGLLPGELMADQSSWLFSPHQHMPLMAHRRARMIINRVRLFAFLFAVLTPLWIVVDVLTLPDTLWPQLMALRLLASAAFIGLVYSKRQAGMLNAYRAMATLFAIPTVFYVISHLLLTRYSLQGLSAAISAGYAFLPFVLLAGFAIFPLTLLESLAFATPVLVAYGLAGIEHWVGGSWPAFSAEYWLLILITGVSTLASISQLVLMMALVGQAIRDPLTGCYSRRSGEEILALQFEQSTRTGTPLSLAFIDLDHFKQINDRYGHEAGDQVLKSLVKAISARLRRGDVLTRWGGEEFLLILPNTDCQQSLQALARLYQQGLGTRPDGHPQTASTGTAERINDGCNSWEDLVACADSRMYQAKSSGRDSIHCHAPEHARPACAICNNYNQNTCATKQPEPVEPG